MKKTLFFASIFTLLAFMVQASVPTSGNTAPKSNSTYFSMEQEQINAEMADLNALDQFVTENEGTTFTQMAAENNPLVSDATAVNGLDMEDAFQKGDGMPTWAIVLIVVGGVLLLLLVLCCILGSLGSSVE